MTCHAPHWRRIIFQLATLMLLPGCATATLTESGSLSSYEGFQASDGLSTKTKSRVDQIAVLGARTASITPTTFVGNSSTAKLTDEQRKLIGSTIDRALCNKLSNRLDIVAADADADIAVHAVVTHIVATDAAVAGLSKVAAFASPVPLPRIPIGLGGLSVEGEALDRHGTQIAGIVWARGANAITTRPRASSASDAFSLANTFGSDFSKMLLKATDPMKVTMTLGSTSDVAFAVTGKATDADCEAFGQGSGFLGFVGSILGLPPEWTETTD